jgi:hypothetical protein
MPPHREARPAGASRPRARALARRALLLVLCAAAAAQPLSPPPLPSAGDAACSRVTNRWRLDASGVAGATLIDSVGGWNGTAYGGYSTANGALTLDGLSGYADLGSRTFGGAMSWAFWARVDAWQTWERFFDFGAAAGGTTGYNLCASATPNGVGDTLSVSVYPGNTYDFSSAAKTLRLGVWQHHVMTVDESGWLAYYIDGARVIATQANVAQTKTRTHLYLGKSWWIGTGAPDRFFKGALSNFQFALGTAFSAYDAANLYNGAGCPPAPPPPPALPTASFAGIMVASLVAPNLCWTLDASLATESGTYPVLLAACTSAPSQLFRFDGASFYHDATGTVLDVNNGATNANVTSGPGSVRFIPNTCGPPCWGNDFLKVGYQLHFRSSTGVDTNFCLSAPSNRLVLGLCLKGVNTMQWTTISPPPPPPGPPPPSPPLPYTAFPGCADAASPATCYALVDLYLATQLDAAAWDAALAAPPAAPGANAGGWLSSSSNYCAWRGVGCRSSPGVPCLDDNLEGCMLDSLCVPHAPPPQRASRAAGR